MSFREVTERDFRSPEFRDAKIEDYEFRDDGKLVRKDRWECGIHDIKGIIGISGCEFEIPDVVNAVRQITDYFGGWFEAKDESNDPDDWPEKGVTVELQLEDGSLLRNASYDQENKYWKWCNAEPHLQVIAWRKQQELPIDMTYRSY